VWLPPPPGGFRRRKPKRDKRRKRSRLVTAFQRQEPGLSRAGVVIMGALLAMVIALFVIVASARL
jgi:hypothetical protein